MLLMAVAVLCLSCSKVRDVIAISSPSQTQYIIEAGQQNATSHPFRTVELTTQRFTVRFDSSAIYKTLSPENQFDINKLYGFSDNGSQHHEYSARLGWRWSENALRLFGYVYNAGIVSSIELCQIPIGALISCSIEAADGQYIFTVGTNSWTLPRLSAPGKAKGYQLYPYFGGDELAPHQVRIWIEEN
jgi:hypothetical protein